MNDISDQIKTIYCKSYEKLKYYKPNKMYEFSSEATRAQRKQLKRLKRNNQKNQRNNLLNQISENSHSVIAICESVADFIPQTAGYNYITHEYEKVIERAVSMKILLSSDPLVKVGTTYVLKMIGKDIHFGIGQHSRTKYHKRKEIRV